MLLSLLLQAVVESGFKVGIQLQTNSYVLLQMILKTTMNNLMDSTHCFLMVLDIAAKIYGQWPLLVSFL